MKRCSSLSPRGGERVEIEGLTLVTADPKVQALGVAWLW
jgi:hypothetical protein